MTLKQLQKEIAKQNKRIIDYQSTESGDFRNIQMLGAGDIMYVLNAIFKHGDISELQHMVDTIMKKDKTFIGK